MDCSIVQPSPPFGWAGMQQHIPPEYHQAHVAACSMMPPGGGCQHGGLIPMCGGNLASGVRYAMMPPGDAPGGCTASGAPCIQACMVVAADGTQQFVVPYPSSQPLGFHTVQCAVTSQSCQLPPAMYNTMPSLQGAQGAHAVHGLHGGCAVPSDFRPAGMVLEGGMSMGGRLPPGDGGCFPAGMPSNGAGGVTSSRPKVGEVVPASKSARTSHSRRGSGNAPIASGMQPYTLPCLGSAECPSQGSVGHEKGSCRPCAFFHSPGCANGIACPFCHLCDAGERKRRKKEQQQSKKSTTKFRAAARIRP